MLKLRIILALLLITAIAACSSPLLSWGAALQEQLVALCGRSVYAHSYLRLMCLGGLCLACTLLPPIQQHITLEKSAHTYARFLAIGTGMLLVIEPLIVMIILGYGSVFTDVNFLALITPGRLLHDPAASSLKIGYFILFIVLTPMCEEWFFRGRLFSWIRCHLDPISTVSISTLAFAVAHANVLQSLIAIPLGLLLGYMRLKGASLRICICIHALHNLLFFVLGGFLIIQPGITIACSAGGCWLLATGLSWHGNQHLPRRVLIITMAGTLAIAALSPLYVRCCDALWAHAVYRQINNPAQFHQHLVLCLRRSSIRPNAQDNLLALFNQDPLNDLDRQFWVEVLFTSEILIQKCSDDQYAYRSLQHISTYPGTLREFHDFARAIASKNPQAFITFISHAPDFLKLWVPNGNDPQLSNLLDSSIFHRRGLLRVMLRTYGHAHCIHCLLRIQEAHIHPRDLMFIRSEYEYHQLILKNALDTLNKEQPQLADAWKKNLHG